MEGEKEYPARQERAMGTTESNWCSAVDGGTGTTVSGILLGRPLAPAPLQAALSHILSSQPLLRAHIVDKQGQPYFEIDANTLLHVQVIEKEEQKSWLQIVEDEMNEGFPTEKPFRVFQVHLYNLPEENTLVLLRLHSAAADFASAVHVSSELLKHLKELVELREGELDGVIRETISDEDEYELECKVPSLEAATPPAKARKPFWAHGLDVLGYGLGAFRHAILPLENVEDKWQSKVIVADFTKSVTNNMLQVSKKKSSNLSGLLNAASLKAVGKFKGTGNRGEHYATVVLLNCRSMLEPQISDSTAGFYHSAIMKTVHVTETVSLWELATRITKDFDQAVKNNKHFTDMGDLNMLMVQAMLRPAVTPSSSMRTALLSNVYDPCCQEVDRELASSLNLKDWITCTSLNGIGPCLALYPVIRDGCLRVSFVYCNPLFSAETMHSLVDDVSSMLNNLDDEV